MKSNHQHLGQSLIEFALLLPLLLLLIMGLFDIGRAIFYFAVLNNAVREGTRFAIVQPYYDLDASDSYPLNCDHASATANVNICQEIRQYFFDIGELATSTVTINRTFSGTNDPLVVIGIDYLFSPITPGVALLGDLPIQVNSQMLLTRVAIP